MNIYNIYIIFKKKTSEIYSNFLKSFSSLFLRLKNNIIEIIDFGYYFFDKKIKRICFLKINCEKKTLKRIFRIFKNKNELIINYIILKKNINNYIINLNLISNYVSSNFKIYSSILKNIKYKKHDKFSKIIKKIRILKIIPINFITYIKKINYFIC